MLAAHCIIYGLINEYVSHYKPKTILCRNLKTIDFELLTDDMFIGIDDRIGLMNYIISYYAPTTGKRVRENDDVHRKEDIFCEVISKNKTSKLKRNTEIWPPKSAEMQLNNLQNEIGKDQ